MISQRTFSAVQRHLRERLTPKRYHHSHMTAMRAVALAKRHEGDWYRAYVAGLFHDICHDDEEDLQLKYLEGHGILLDDFTRSLPQIWHAKTGAVLLEQMGLEDRQVLRAVRYHTTGRADMSLLEKIVYLADATGSDRDYPGVEELRALADRDLDAAMRRSLAYIVGMLVEKGQPIVWDTWEAYNYYLYSQNCK